MTAMCDECGENQAEYILDGVVHPYTGAVCEECWEPGMVVVDP